MAVDPKRARMSMPPVDGAMVKVSPKGMIVDSKDTAYLGEKDDDRSSDEKVMARMRKRMERAAQAESENRKDGLDDLNFRKGRQWPSEVIAQRNIDKRPCLTINKLPTFIHQITNDQRQNRPGIKVSPVGDRGDVEVAKMYGGLSVVHFLLQRCLSTSETVGGHAPETIDA